MTASEARKLSDAIREVKNAMADRDDVVVELREAQRTRLELLALELEPVFADVPADAIQFDLVISQGLQPRLWIDMSAHVAMGRDRRTYRFVRDTRLGRTVLAETPDLRTVADHVTRYIAERLIERERLIEGAPLPIMEPVPEERDRPANLMAALARAPLPAASVSAPEQKPATAPSAPAEPPLIRYASWAELATGLFLVLGGALVALILLVLLFWDRLPGLWH